MQLRARLKWAFAALLLGGWALTRAPSAGGQAPVVPAPLGRVPVAPAPVGKAPVVPARVGPASAPGGVFNSLEGCEAELSGGRRLARAPGKARFASWNLHWFPDGKPGAGQPSSGARGATESAAATGGANLRWLACALWWLDADVVALQEVKQTPRAVEAAEQLRSELNRLSGASYQLRVDDCGSRVPQHVGLLWNAARVKASDVMTLAELNPSGTACGQQLRPGLAARLRFTGGLDLLAVSAHFKSAPDARSLELRRASFSALAGVARDSAGRSGDADLLLLGDLNTMGCEECTPPVSAQDELRELEALLAPGPVRLVPADAAGSYVRDGRVTPLDHALAARSMRELEPAARTQIVAACVDSARALSKRQAKRMRQQLSDHCPIVLDLSDRDLD